MSRYFEAHNSRDKMYDLRMHMYIRRIFIQETALSLEYLLFIQKTAFFLEAHE